jgi:hypothetical protein
LLENIELGSMLDLYNTNPPGENEPTAHRWEESSVKNTSGWIKFEYKTSFQLNSSDLSRKCAMLWPDKEFIK